MFIRPLEGSGILRPSSHYTLPIDGEDTADNDTTPLTYSNDQKENELADTPEFNSSWLSRATFSWLDNSLRQGAVRRLEYSDLYRLDPEDHPALWVGRHIGMRIKGVLIAELSSKTLRRRGKGSWDKGSNSEDNDSQVPQIAADGKLMNLLTADFQRVIEVSTYLDRAYAMPTTLMVGIWYMYKVLGVSAIFGVAIAGVYVPLTRVMYKHLTKLEDKTTSLSDERVSAISEVLQGIKAVKLFGWESRFVKIVEERRENQLQYQWKVYMFMTLISAVGLIGPMLILIITFSVYVVGFGNKLTAEVAFTAISVFQLMRVVLERMPGFFSWATNAAVSLKRIDLYLHQPQVQSLEKRVHASTENYTAASDALGFESAYLEWEVSGDYNNNAKTMDSTPTSISLPSTNIGTPDIGHKCDGGQPTEETPLLTAQLQTPSASSPSSSSTSLDIQGDIVAFSLKDIDVQFPIGELSIVAGPTGSGKSSLLSALIGEMTLTRGRVLLPTVDARAIAANDTKYKDVINLSGEGLVIRDIAYVAQESWLRNATIRENILFGEPYDKNRYEEVLRVCALKPDLRILKAGDMTEIGERGVTLSGGQKQRVALARAIYSSRRILLIDDCLSAVDAHTGKHILMECLLSKTYLMQGRTCVLVTHHLSMCLPFAQYLLIMHEGRIAIKGSPEELQEQGILAKMIAELETAKRSLKADRQKSYSRSRSRSIEKKQALARRENKGKVVDNAIYSIADYSRKNASTEKNLVQHINDRKSEDEYNAERLLHIAEQRGFNPGSDLSALHGTLIEEEEREEGHVKFDVWQTYLSACGSEKFWVTSLLMLVFCQAVVVLQDYWVRLWVASTNGVGAATTATRSVPSFALTLSDQLEMANREHHTSAYWLGVYVFVGLVSVVVRTVQKYHVFSGALNASRIIHTKLLGSVIHATPRFFDSTPFGRIINRFSREMLAIDERTMDLILWWASDCVAVVSVFAIIMAVTPMYIFIAAIVVSIYVAIGYYYLNSSRELKRLESNSMSPLLSLFSELILGVSTIRAFSVKHYYLKEAINQINTQNRPFYMVWSASRWLEVRINFVSAVVSFTCALFILFNLEWIDAGLAGFALMYSLTFSERMMYVIRNFSDNELNMNAVERIMQYMDVEQEAPLHSNPRHSPPARWPESGTLHIKNLEVEYVPGVPVLHKISLSVSHGEKIGVVGRTGSGKSTLALALLRFIEASKGRVVLDGINIAKIGLEDLRRNVTIIPQDPVLFNGTIRFNLDPFNEYPDEILWDALRRTFLVLERNSQFNNAEIRVVEGANGIDNEAPMLERMSGIFTSLDADIKENGQNLSLGQRQLVALARALVRRSRLIIMDEATASVDFDTDDRIQRTIRGHEFTDSTLFCVAHRLRTIIDYDRVLVLDKGNIAEFDTPQNLLQNKGGIFRNMCENSGEYDHLYAVANRKHSGFRPPRGPV
ncbi:hypothetical protein GGI26_000617 [Coemansia sp. RSA 1358]|uniref:P-loop containing nucleoside triphosphate hydrolase protein n=1 Tax=Coemansia umbellata TaxID=1424467 RepID=A0ABQ8PVD7_9FUNG|nr:hypothetical protein EDC05_000404 [Coemansia umbellata]KAJ2625477.1 hypothetical protein GGI26_000617 [Coemansia sp. RSA 1358]